MFESFQTFCKDKYFLNRFKVFFHFFASRVLRHRQNLPRKGRIYLLPLLSAIHLILVPRQTLPTVTSLKHSLRHSRNQPEHQQLDFVRRKGVFSGQVSQNANSSVKRRGFTDNLKKNDDLKEHVLQIIIGNKQNQNVSTLD